MPRRRSLSCGGYAGSGKLHGRVAIVTGGESGIGRATCVLFAREGAAVSLSYLPDEQVDAETTAEHGGARRAALPAAARRSAGPRLLRSARSRHGAPLRPARRPGQQRRLPAAPRVDCRHRRRSVGSHLPHQRLRLLLPGTGGAGLHEPRILDRQRRVGGGPRRQRAVARLRRGGGRDPRVHQVAGQEPAWARHPRECGGTGAGVATKSRRAVDRDCRPSAAADSPGRSARRSPRRLSTSPPKPIPATSPARS